MAGCMRQQFRSENFAHHGGAASLQGGSAKGFGSGAGFSKTVAELLRTTDLALRATKKQPLLSVALW